MCSGCGARFVTGFFVTVPLVVSVVAIVWVFRWADRLTSGLASGLSASHVPGLGIAGDGADRARRRRRGDQRLRAPAAASAESSCCCTCRCSARSTRRSSSSSRRFRRTTSSGSSGWCWSRTRRAGFVLGFPHQGVRRRSRAGPETLLAVYVPTNHLYLGDIMICRPGSGVVSGYDGGGRHSGVSDRRHGAARTRATEREAHGSRLD